MTQLLKQARDVQKKIEEVQNELDDLTIEGDSGGGMVKVVVNGKQQLLELGAAAVLVKPVTQRQIFAQLQTHLTKAL